MMDASVQSLEGEELCNGMDDDCDGAIDEDFHVGIRARSALVAVPVKVLSPVMSKAVQCALEMPETHW